MGKEIQLYGFMIERDCTKEYEHFLKRKGKWSDTVFIGADKKLEDKSGRTYIDAFFEWQGNCNWIPVWCEILN